LYHLKIIPHTVTLFNLYFQILRVGVTVARYVTLTNSRPWVVHAYKNTKGRGVRQELEKEVIA